MVLFDNLFKVRLCFIGIDMTKFENGLFIRRDIQESLIKSMGDVIYVDKGIHHLSTMWLCPDTISWIHPTYGITKKIFDMQTNSLNIVHFCTEQWKYISKYNMVKYCRKMSKMDPGIIWSIKDCECYCGEIVNHLIKIRSLYTVNQQGINNSDDISSEFHKLTEYNINFRRNNV